MYYYLGNFDVMCVVGHSGARDLDLNGLSGTFGTDPLRASRIVEKNKMWCS
jgi:hypothetical protein